jgi:hypothetical protein
MIVVSVNGYGKMKKYKANKNGLKVKTDSGFQEFEGIAYMGNKEIYRLEFDNDYWLECTEDHEIYISEYNKIKAIDLEIGKSVVSIDKKITLLNKFKTKRIEPVYDLIGVYGNNRFYGNNILVSNCKFIAYDETLINSIFLSNMNEGLEPHHKTGQVRWYKPVENEKTYIVSLDPSLGTGGDYSAIQVVVLPELEQVAEWQSNITPIKAQITVLKQICDYIKSESSNSEIYWSVENNSIGEASLVTITELGEENIPGIFLSQPKRMDGIKKSKKYRKGFTTTHTSKLAACARLKHWVESDKLKINSRNLIRELKTFVSRGTTYKAKEGETDDLVMSLILAVRMIEVIARYDEDMFDDIKNTFDDDDEYMNEPMPVGFL